MYLGFRNKGSFGKFPRKVDITYRTITALYSVSWNNISDRYSYLISHEFNMQGEDIFPLPLDNRVKYRRLLFLPYVRK